MSEELEKALEQGPIVGIDVAEPTDAPKEKEITTPEEAQAAFFNDPEQRKQATMMALNFQAKMGTRWFNFERFLVKTKETRSAAAFKLELLSGFGLLAIKEGTAQDGAGQLGKQLFRLIISIPDQHRMYDEMIAEYEKQIGILIQRKKQINEAI